MPDSANTKAAAPKPSRRRRLTRTTFRWLWRGIKVVALLLLVALPLGVGWISWTNHQGQRAVEDAVRAVVDQGEFPPEPVAIPAEENGARHLRAAAILMFVSETRHEDWPVFGMADWPEFGVPLEADQIETLTQMVELSRDGYRAMKAARAYESFDFDPQREFDLQQKLEVLSGSRHLARWLSIRHLLLIEQDKPEQAAEMVGDVLLVAKSLRQDDTLLSALVDLSIVALGFSMVEDSLSRQEFPDDALARMQCELITAVDGWDTLNIMKREAQRDLARWLDPDEALNHTLAQGIYISDVWEQVRQTIHEEFTGTPYERVEAWWYDWANRIGFASYWICPGRMQLRMVREYEYMLQALEQVENDGEVDPALLDEVDDTEFYTPKAVDSNLRTLRQGRTTLYCHIYGLEAERYRLREGAWPTSIEQIQLSDLPPIDDWGNRLAVTRTEQGFKVYSFGSNGRDDSGLDRWDDYDMADFPNDEPDDWNMTLLDPDIRGTLELEDESFDLNGLY
ncbi:hypothetical protein [Algisphaera agarilytica]|uniref:Uncharacterized protein n=1 Tax=Algisphaera agarilytica TaxID=1385975 RepID=A0A7X0LJR2_9BACT|nr:hypothetical protein [Algisphaera agarilytica]MBB6429645.1 hypothetical protein [Algisphaera agarilytica]